jgi:asparagine synthetase B (glutamine-hydrolysing)
VVLGTLWNLPSLRQAYGLTKNVNDVMVMVEAFKAMSGRGLFHPNRVLNHFEGSFAFVLFNNGSKTLLVTNVSKVYHFTC